VELKHSSHTHSKIMCVVLISRNIFCPVGELHCALIWSVCQGLEFPGSLLEKQIIQSFHLCDSLINLKNKSNKKRSLLNEDVVFFFELLGHYNLQIFVCIVKKTGWCFLLTYFCHKSMSKPFLRFLRVCSQTHCLIIIQ